MRLSEEQKIQEERILARGQQNQWEQIINDIVRPPRCEYTQSSLGAKFFILNEIHYERIDKIVIHENKRLILTIYDSEKKNGWIILYLHGNSSSRLESTSIIKFLPYNFSLASFDFMGCGLNQELNTISLGFRESKQTETIVNQLIQCGYKVILWGRSMGAATALKYGKAPIIVADSSFASFRKLCNQVAKQKSSQSIPNVVADVVVDCFFPCVFSKLRNDVKQKADYDVEELNIQQSVKKINPSTFLIFISGDEDSLVNKRHSERLFKMYPSSKKHLEIFKGTHNTKRPDSLIKKIMNMIKQSTEERDRQQKQNYKIKNIKKQSTVQIV